jgi:glutaminyl-peptide cyclotransferase
MHRRVFLALSASLAAGAAVLRTPVLFALQDFSMTARHAFRVLNTFPHDSSAFTQGLLFHAGYLYESTGGWGTSSLRQVELKTGQVLRKLDLPRQYFGEGLALWEDRLIQLTWQSGRGFVYDLESFKQIASFTYPGEGWGLTHDGQELIMSDGTSVLRRIDPDSYLELGRFSVFDQGRQLPGLNELEFIQGEIWANVFPSDVIVRIDPQSGHVLSWIDLSGILGPRRRVSMESVTNGIAYDPESQRIFVTGKNWPMLFEISILPG